MKCLPLSKSTNQLASSLLTSKPPRASCYLTTTFGPLAPLSKKRWFVHFGLRRIWCDLDRHGGFERRCPINGPQKGGHRHHPLGSSCYGIGPWIKWPNHREAVPSSLTWPSGTKSCKPIWTAVTSSRHHADRWARPLPTKPAGNLCFRA